MQSLNNFFTQKKKEMNEKVDRLTDQTSNI